MTDQLCDKTSANGCSCRTAADRQLLERWLCPIHMIEELICMGWRLHSSGKLTPPKAAPCDVDLDRWFLGGCDGYVAACDQVAVSVVVHVVKAELTAMCLCNSCMSMYESDVAQARAELSENR